MVPSRIDAATDAEALGIRSEYVSPGGAVMSIWIVIAVIGAVSYLLRVSMFVVLAGRTLPSSLERPMSVVGPAAIGALLATMVFTSGGRFDPLPTAESAPTLAAFLVVRRTGDVMHAFTVGFPLMWIVAAPT